MKCLLSDAMLSYSQSQSPSFVSSKSATPTPTSIPIPPANGVSPLSQANVSLLNSSPGGSGDGAICNRSAAEAQGEQRDSAMGKWRCKH